MASDIKWIKLAVDLFDDEKILLISSMPDGYNIIIVWIKLLCLAGKQNNSGVFKLSNGMPYTVKMLATIFRLDESLVSHALDTFESFGMVQTVGGVVTISNWGRHQNLDKIEASNEYMRNYMKEYRAKQKAIATGEKQSKPNSKPKSKTKIRSADIELDKEQDKDKDIEIDTDIELDVDTDKIKDIEIKNATSLNYGFIVKSFHSICKSLPKVAKLSARRRQAIQAASDILQSNGASFEQLFEQAERSDFLKGLVKDWHADFDWIMKPDNIIKILSGKYDARTAKATVNYSDQSRYENLSMEGDK